ncbi:syringomycin biosynthesis enzyme-like protein [Arabidopsis thaliana]|jgi:alpha-ketoglutarate-dependent taurine dioxygenase|uniref:Clavaminate synthase-like protein At3g21360 n=2 Tax=Arabidopsis thaliana TaxID=3702 RepID=Y3136_ARATH|nr:2-oxoglutarate (2OG) and Fe(II)-dependent oxygenase superfamily protein [Arabidopsis thaliana]Q9LIG0.1 RecName: Full=Clavaminate synthase-like protein At3g21360 [Arabidopsis thaliana]1Y0Z_A Chain A, protein product of AT3G21360 [Arabidopsis thaliana]1Y0Z_B Chain B, protein product of AT3G21360 [Arabidopsis thaliana]2Q4A_A Chain A, Clavaminate synthase-like protein At3g21360 [Arabidopsis thaliana]2Q4A_B Chain B, Clavaminate synthase-like protein At3g21360 [Arabidopsis thaliana]ACB88834.1 At|eukprot:NP_188773.1 2-oxoglutarate (2OG) and Fe(II)-dependent oxygenase superfamily protein [Arabidopsis thaliana]
MAELLLVETPIPQQKHYESKPFPAVISPPSASIPIPALSLPLFTQTIKTQKHYLDSLLHESGAVLFRGFPVNSADDFNDVVEAFGFDELPYVGGAAPRTSVVGRVFTANESPPDQKIPFHHEMAQVREFPSKLFFYCEIEPKCGGETPIVLSHVVYERMKDKHPEFVQRLEEHGLLYVRVLGEDDDPSSPIGRGWKSTFLTHDKNLAEQRAVDLGMKLEWTEDGGAKTVMGPIPAIKYDESRNRKVWFNSMVAAYTGWEDKRNDPRKAVTFGDGKPLPADIVHDCLRILEEECVAVPWQRGDVLLIDNWAVLHSRRPFDPPRRVLASLCK